MRLLCRTGRLAREMHPSHTIILHPSPSRDTSRTTYTKPLARGLSEPQRTLSEPQRTLSAPMLTPSELHFLGLADEIHSQGMPQRSLPRTASVHEFGQYGALLRKFSKRPSSKLERFIYKKRGQVWRMDLVEGGCRSRGSWAVSKDGSGRKQQKRRERQSLARDWWREGWEVASWSRGVSGCISGLLL